MYRKSLANLGLISLVSAVTIPIAQNAAQAACSGTGGTISTASTTCQNLSSANDNLTVTNTGALNISSSNSAVNVSSQTTGVTVTNSGTISDTASGNRAITASGASQNLTITNNSGALIQATGDDAIHGGSGGTPITSGTILINNYGTIQSLGTTSSTNGQAIDFDNTSGSVAITINNYATGVITAADSDAIRPGANATVNNYGTITSNSVNGDTGNDGIDFQSHAGGTVNNYAGGSITGARHGITGSGSITVYNEGTITGNLGSGINIDSTSGITYVTNTASGVITGNAGGTTDGDGIDVDYLVSINNYGKIYAYGTSTGNLSEAITVGGGTINNYAGGVIYSVQRAITVDDSNGGNAYGPTTIYNEGTIQGGNGEAISITDTFGDTITNKGVIIGSITTGTGNDTFNFYGGSSITGQIDGRAGTDVINLYGAGSGTLANVINIEQLHVFGGIWTIPDTQTYANGVTIDGGTLEVDGSLTSSGITVNSGGTLSGDGTITDPIINAGGTLAPGTASAIGTLTINGPLTFEAGSNYNVRVTATSNDSTNVVGVTTINGGTVNVSAANGTYKYSTTYTILTSTLGVSGTFSSVTSNLAFVTPSLSYDADDVYLTLTRNGVSFSSVATNKNQAAVGFALDNAVKGNPGAGGVTILNAVYNLSADQARAAYDSISGEGIAAADTAGLQANQLFSSAMADQTTLWLDGGRSGGNEMVLSAPAPGALFYANAAGMKTPIVVHDPLMPAARTWRAWASGFGGDENVHGNASLGTTGQSAAFYGGAMGIDYQINPTLLFGVAGGGSDASFNVPGRTTYGSVTGAHIGTYGVATFGAFYGASSTSFSFFHNSETRMIAGFGGLGGEKEHGGYDSRAVRTRLEFGRRFGDVYGATITPFVALEIADLRSNGFTETPMMGAGSFALNVQGRDTVSVPAYMGLRFERLFDLSGGMTLKPVLSLAYGHDFAPQREITNALVGLASNPFEIDGAQVARDFAQTKAGFELAFAPNAVAFVNFDGKFSSRDQVYVGKGGIKLAW